MEMVIGLITFTSGAFKGPKLLPLGVPSEVSPLRSHFREKFNKQKLFSYPKNYGTQTVKWDIGSSGSRKNAAKS